MSNYPFRCAGSNCELTALIELHQTTWTSLRQAIFEAGSEDNCAEVTVLGQELEDLEDKILHLKPSTLAQLKSKLGFMFDIIGSDCEDSDRIRLLRSKMQSDVESLAYNFIDSDVGKSLT